MNRILVCTDGEPHSRKAEEQAVVMAELFGAEVTGLYVQSTFLRKFTYEIYAVNRNECSAHLDAELRREGIAALEALGDRCATHGVSYKSLIRQGDIAQEILAEANSGLYDLLILGAKVLSTWRERIESVNLPQAVFKGSRLPTLFVR
jgi:nucleotide-binding universal stress UspA family protein